jgi:hypothetical protein
MRSTVRCEIPRVAARRRLLQRAAPGGFSCSVLASTASTSASLIERGAPFTDSLRRDFQLLRALAVRPAGMATEHDPRSHCRRSPVLTTPHPLLELLLLIARQCEGLQLCTSAGLYAVMTAAILRAIGR